MHTRSAAIRRSPGVHLARVAALATALTAQTALIVADVTAAEAEEPAALAFIDDSAELDAPPPIDAPVLLAVVMPDAATPSPALPLLLDLALDERHNKPQKPRKKRGGKLKFGRFEGY